MFERESIRLVEEEKEAAVRVRVFHMVQKDLDVVKHFTTGRP